MKILKIKVFEGKNIYSYKKCIRLDVDLCGFAETPSKDIYNFNSGLLKLIPELYTHRCGIDEDRGFVKRLDEGTYLGHICEHIVIAIQNKLGIDVSYGKAREIEGDLYYIIFQYEYKGVALETARLAIDIINSLINNQAINFQARIKILEEILRKEIIGPSTKAIKEAAERYGLPVFQIDDSGFYQVGYGRQGRIIEATIGAQTSCVSADIASDKVLTKELLKIQKIPVANGSRVSNIISLLKEGERIGYPLVMKPRYGSKGEDVYVNITTEKELVKTFNKVKDKHNELIIEKYIEGLDYRVCVVGYNVVAVALRTPPSVVGDGKNNIKTLIGLLNENPIRGFDHEKPLTKVKIDKELLISLEKQNVSLSTILKEGEKILLRENANISTGGVATDYSNRICEENKRLCIRAAKAIGLDICGIDIKALDISKPLDGQGVIIEINAAPGIRMHEYPFEGSPKEVGEAILNLQYNGVPVNIPIISITGTNGKTTTTRLISHIYRSIGYIVGMTSTDGIFIDGRCIDKGDDTGFNSAKTVLLNKDVEVAVLETARGGLIKNGLAYDFADVAIITNINDDHIGMDSVSSIEELAHIKALVAETVKEDGYVIINADDKWSKNIIEKIKAKIVFFSKYKDNELISKAINEDGIAVYLDDQKIYITNHRREYKIIDLKSMPIALGGILEFNIENAMAACAGLVALGVDYCMITKGLKTFKLNETDNSGRFNVYELNGVKVILDYGHNYDGYKAILSAVNKMKYNRLIGVIGMPGDRRNDSVVSVGELCGEYLDNVIIKEDKDRRGRKKGEVARLLEVGVKNIAKKKNCKINLDEVEAFEEAIRISSSGDIIIVFYEQLDPLIGLIKQKQNEQNTRINIATV